MEALADNLKIFYDWLYKKGFNEEQALQLTIAYVASKGADDGCVNGSLER
jgi:hypothetical protein